jgi:hypothetical protein
MPVLLLAQAATGCGGAASKGPSYPSARLEGSVTVDGKPIEEGVMQFLPPPNSPAPVLQAEIKNGRYVVSGVPLGKVGVLFNAVKDTGRTDSKSTSSPIPVYENIVPEKYRDGITIEVTKDNPSQNFELRSK